MADKKIKTLGGMNQRPTGAKTLNPRPTTGGVQPTRPSSGPINLQKSPAPVKQAPQKSVAPQKAVAPQKSLNAGASALSGATLGTNKQSSANDDMNSFINVMKNMVGGFAVLRDDVIEKNVRLAAGDGMTIDDRTISYECAEYVVSNMAYIIMGLVLETSFKDVFVEAVSVEMSMDEMEPEVRAKARQAMKDPREYNSVGTVVIGVSEFSPQITESLMKKMDDGFKALDGFADEFDKAVAQLPLDVRIEYGFVFSNFMYLIRAFTHNDVFMSYVVTVVEQVKAEVAKLKK